MDAVNIQITRPRLTVAMIVCNEEQVLDETLANVRPIADELLIEDTGSADATCRIAERYGARVERSPWTEDFSAARNACFRRVGGDWVLWIDAGESLLPSTADALRKFVDREASPKKAYLLRVEIPPPPGESSGEQIAQLRLLPVGAELHFEGRVRESAAGSARAAGLAFEIAPGCILRHARQHDPDRRRRRARRNLILAERETAEHPQPVSRLFLVQGEACELLGEYEKARAAFTQAIAAAPHGSTEMLEGYYGLIGCGGQSPGIERINLCLKALEVFPYDAQLLLTMGGYLQGENRLDLATRAFKTAGEVGRVDLETWHLSDLAEVATACYCTALQLQGKTAEAGRVLEGSLTQHPHSARIKRLGLETFIQLGRTERALEIADALFDGLPDRELLDRVVRGACFARNRRWTAALASLQSAYLSGCKHPLCLRWLAATLISQGQAEAALPVLEQWRQVEPEHPELRAYLAALAGKTSRKGVLPLPTAGQSDKEMEEIDGGGKMPLPPSDSQAGRQYRLDPAGPAPAPFPIPESIPPTLPSPYHSR